MKNLLLVVLLLVFSYSLAKSVSSFLETLEEDNAEDGDFFQADMHDDEFLQGLVDDEESSEFLSHGKHCHYVRHCRRCKRIKVCHKNN